MLSWEKGGYMVLIWDGDAFSYSDHHLSYFIISNI